MDALRDLAVLILIGLAVGLLLYGSSAHGACPPPEAFQSDVLTVVPAGCVTAKECVCYPPLLHAEAKGRLTRHQKEQKALAELLARCAAERQEIALDVGKELEDCETALKVVEDSIQAELLKPPPSSPPNRATWFGIGAGMTVVATVIFCSVVDCSPGFR